MSVFWNGRRIGKPAEPIGATKTRKDGNVYKKNADGSWEYVAKAKPEKTKTVIKYKRSKYR